MTWTLPNLLTTLRLSAAPGLALVFLALPRPYADWGALVLFVLASVTDWLDGHIARAWQQQSRLGAMLDPIADKAMVSLAFLVLATQSSLSAWVLLPATLILFREVFVAGLREFLGQTAGTLKVTKLAKSKTMVQMIAIAVLLAHGGVEHDYGLPPFGGPQLSGPGPQLVYWSALLGLALLWLAAALTVISGWDYFRKALPHLKEDR